MAVLTDTRYAGAQSNSVGSGMGAVSNPNNTLGVPDSVRCSASKGPTAGSIPGNVTMTWSSFGFALPPCFIRGIALRLWAGNTGSAATSISGSINLGGISATSKGTTFPAPSSVPVQSYGSSVDLWNAALTQAVVNGSGFGVVCGFTCTPGTTGSGKTVRLEIDGIEMTVYYEPIIFPNRFKMML